MHNRGPCFLLQLIPYAVTLPETISIPAFQSFTLAILLFFAGQKIAEYWGVVRRYSIPEPVVGGFACALVVGLIYYTTGSKIEFDLNVRDTLLLYFFAAIGLRSDLLTLKQGGKPLLILLALATGFILLQNLLGMGVAELFGLDSRAGLMTGSISLTGGVGTTLAWGPTFVEKLGIHNAVELGMASNMVGMIACLCNRRADCQLPDATPRHPWQRRTPAGRGCSRTATDRDAGLLWRAARLAVAEHGAHDRRHHHPTVSQGGPAAAHVCGMSDGRHFAA